MTGVLKKKRPRRAGVATSSSKVVPSTTINAPQVHWLLAGSSAIGIIIVLISSFCLLSLNNPELQFFLDEGIYLDGARQVMEGAAPYRDFFALTGPGTFWLYGSIFNYTGLSYTTAHYWLYAEIATITAAVYACLFWVSKSPLCAGITAGFYLAITVFSQYRIYINHRWDSLWLLSLSMMVWVYTVSNGKQTRMSFVVAGSLAGASGLFTPPVLIVFLSLTVYLLYKASFRKRAIFYFGGGLATSLAAVAVLAKQGALAPAWSMVEWNISHYSSANQVPFGWFHIDAHLFQKSSLVLSIVVLTTLLPTVLAVAVSAITLWQTFRHPRMVPPVIECSAIVAVGVVVSTYPRLAANQLMFALPFFLVVTGWYIHSLKRRNAQIAAGALALLVSTAAILNLPSTPLRQIETAMGTVQCNPFDAKMIGILEQYLIPNSTALVYPYLPIIYSITGTHSPGYYGFLQPGMMNEVDARRMLADCQRNPPSVIVWRHLTDKQILSIWPNTDLKHTKLLVLERFIENHYSKVSLASSVPFEIWIPKI